MPGWVQPLLLCVGGGFVGVLICLTVRRWRQEYKRAIENRNEYHALKSANDVASAATVSVAVHQTVTADGSVSTERVVSGGVASGVLRGGDAGAERGEAGVLVPGPPARSSVSPPMSLPAPVYVPTQERSQQYYEAERHA